MGKATMKTRTELIKRYETKYRKATKTEKGRILDSLCESTGLSRDRARHILACRNPKPKTRKPGRAPIYDAALRPVLEKIWAHMDFACGKRLVAGMTDMLDALTAFGEIAPSPEIAAKLKQISAATADRLLAPARKKYAPKGKSTTKPGTLLKRDIPTRLGSVALLRKARLRRPAFLPVHNEWDDAVPGFVEIDLVAHCGETTAGDYLNTLDVTDICTGWTETQAVLNKAQKHVFEALLAIEQRQPFPYKGIDSDNGSEFINQHLYRWCKERNISFTRSRPGRKNDNAHVEQKNWHVIRRNIGYNRYEGQAAVDAMNEYYGLLRLYANFFLPQTKLLEKVRTGARVKKRYDTPKTPYRRVLESPDIPIAIKAALQKTYATLNPAALQRAMVSTLERLETLQVSSRTSK